MKKSRYTFKDLENALPDLNAKLIKLNHPYRFALGSAYNRTELDLATPEQVAAHCRARMITSGTPRECLAAAQSYIYGLV